MATAKLLEKESYLKIGKQPMVILPLDEWEQIKEFIEDREDAERFNIAFQESRGEKMIGLKELKKKYNLE